MLLPATVPCCCLLLPVTVPCYCLPHSALLLPATAPTALSPLRQWLGTGGLTRMLLPVPQRLPLPTTACYSPHRTLLTIEVKQQQRSVTGGLSCLLHVRTLSDERGV